MLEDESLTTRERKGEGVCAARRRLAEEYPLMRPAICCAESNWAPMAGRASTA